MCIEHERDALLRFKEGIQIDRCGLLSSWSNHEDSRNCCQWHGVRCSNITGHIIMLNLRGIHTRFSDDKCLQAEGLYVKTLSWLSRLTLLRSINLSGVNLRKATNWLQIVNNLPFLRVLQLDSCNVPWTSVPRTLSYNNSSTTLSVLILSQNNEIDSSIFKWLFNLSGINTHLTHLDLSSNELESPLPSVFGSLQALSYLDLSLNKLQDSFVSSLEKMQSLSYLDLSGNQLEGVILDTVSTIKSLTYLDLSWNNIVLPKTFGNFCGLKELYLYHNNITNELSHIIQTLTQCANKSLLSLDLKDNQIWGSIPDSIGNFSSLTDLNLCNNRLNGTVSQSLGQLSKLETLDISSNSLKGTLSNIHFSSQSRLRLLNLQSNKALALNFSFDWVPPFQLDAISLSSCQLGPLFPKWLLSQTDYSQLDIADTGIFDSIPEAFWNSIPSKMVSLNLSHNNIYGTIPNLRNLKLTPNIHEEDGIVIDLSFNNIQGVIPSFPENVTNLFLNNNNFSSHIPFLCPKSKKHLSVLDLSNNLLSGELPDCWINYNQLSILHLENNNFSGVIPSSLAYLQRLQVLHLRNNTISGRMKRMVENLTSLVVLDVSFNSFGGHIPPSIGNNLRKLKILSLGSNNFDGEIPLSLCKMIYLQILDLSSNHIKGTIPKCINNLTAMQTEGESLFSLEYQELHPNVYSFYSDAATIMWKRKEQNFKNILGLVKAIDISNNNIEGEIPIEISFLKSLVSLDLSRNNLTGGITPKFGKLTALQFLDLSNNRLSGRIPASFSNLNFLGILDLSYNHLSGEIPTGTQLQSMKASAYIGNFELCGPPLPKCQWDRQPKNNPTTDDNINQQGKNESIGNTLGLYISVALGFIVGFWGVCGTLVLKRSWRQSFFQFFDDLRDRLYGMLFINMARVRRRQ